MEFVLIYWHLRDRWTVHFSNGASLIGDQLRSQEEAEAAAFEVLGNVDREKFVERSAGDVVRFKSGYSMVRGLEVEERERVKACLAWVHAEGVKCGQIDAESSDAAVAQRSNEILDEARERWPDVAKLIGF
jgi:hypothetical protein